MRSTESTTSPIYRAGFCAHPRGRMHDTRRLSSGRTARVAGLAAGAAAIALLTSGCFAPGSATDSASTFTPIASQVTAADVKELGDITLRVLACSDDEKTLLEEKFIPAFEAAYPNVDVVANYRSFDDLVATVVNVASGDNPPDLFQGTSGFATDGQLVKAGLVRPLDDVSDVYGWKEAEASSLVPATWQPDGSEFGSGTLYGMSPAAEVQVVYYNRQKLADLGIADPQSIQDVAAALPDIAAAGEIPIMFGNADQWPGTHVFSTLAVANQNPADARAWIAGSPGTTFVSEANQDAAFTMAEWASKGYFGEGYDGITSTDAIQRFADGQGVFFIGGSWFSAYLDGEEFGAGALPEGGVGSIAMTWHISSRTENEAAAIAWLAMMRSPEAAQWVLDTGRPPVLTEGVTASTPLGADILGALDATLTADAQIGYYDYVSPNIGGFLQQAVAGRITPKQFTEAIQAEWAETYGR